MTETSEKQVCENCRFYHEEKPDVEPGECRKNSPKVDLSTLAFHMTHWPKVSHDGWCGEWERKE